MPVPYTAAELKARFETGDTPTQQDFADLIDTVFHMAQQAQDQADAAVALAEKASKCYGLATVTYPGGDGAMTYTVNRATGCTFAIATARALESLGGTSNYWKVTVTLTITPTEDFADDDYTVLTSPAINENHVSSNTDAHTVPTVVRTVASCVVTFVLLFPRTGASSRSINALIMP